ncbi:hypothetical protein ACI65C_007455, partial [Semiaphis heraclei]
MRNRVAAIKTYSLRNALDSRNSIRICRNDLLNTVAEKVLILFHNLVLQSVAMNNFLNTALYNLAHQ